MKKLLITGLAVPAAAAVLALAPAAGASTQSAFGSNSVNSGLWQASAITWRHDALPTWLKWRHVKWYDGHRNCVIILGPDTAAITCHDGFATTS